ncbi:hypothetical protein IVB33_28245, partial [Bradyrhizobium sp. 24]|nr:hypothetical protein [Bradyrhizobium sp. 134]MCK1380889.1 hypothetical protein [Bradyrhizobium sp. 24]MCK1774203.1 hypothetical protein [Bradyrhizobium sp. 134]
MEPDREKEEVEAKLARCRELAQEFPTGPTADMIRDMEADILEELRALEHQDRTDQARQVVQECAEDQRQVADKLRKKMN